MNEKTKKTTSSHKQKKRAALSIFLVVAILITAAFAFLSATDSKTNVFTIGSVDIQLWEDFDTDGNGTAETYDASETNKSLSMGNIIPGQTVAKRPYVKNTGNNDAWVYLAVSVPTSANVYRESINDAVALSSTQQEINIKAFAVQDGYGASENDTSREVYNAYFDHALKENAFGGQSKENADEKLFVLNDLNEAYAPSGDSKWTLLETYPMDGKVYFVYGYNELLAAQTGITDDLFTSVTLNTNIGEVEASASDTPSGSGTSLDPKEDDIFTASVVPDGVTITTPDGAVYAAGDTVPETSKIVDGTIIEDGDYYYAYNRVFIYDEWDDEGNLIIGWDEPVINSEVYNGEFNGWGVRVKDPTKSSYGSLYLNLGSADGPEPLRFLDFCFAGCSNMETPPKLPNGIISLDGTFTDCESMTTTPNIPETVKVIFGTFENCGKITKAPVLPDGLVTMEYMFIHCASLTEMPNIPASVINMEGAFCDCPALTTVQDIPVGVENMMSTFCGCSSLTTAPTIPSSVTNIESVFEGCSLLSGKVTINANPTSYSHWASETNITGVIGETTMAQTLMAAK